MAIKTKGQIKKGIQKLRHTKRYEEASLSHIEKLLMFSLEVKREAKRKVKLDDVFVRDPAATLAKGREIADFSRIVINDNFILDKFGRICEIQSTFDGDTRQAMDRLKAVLAAGKVDFSGIQQQLARGNMRYFSTQAKRIGIERGMLHATCLAVYRPLFELCAEANEASIPEYGWKKGSCPLCGTPAGMARLEAEQGRRILWCPLCGTEWVYKRLQCPFCGNENQKKLRYFFVEGEETPYRVDVCNRCKRYVKTIDERKRAKGEKTVFEIENMLTFYLDGCAKKEGFRSI
jgi:hypothetical protein